MTEAKARERVVVAMSGGVDSSVAAALVVRAGYEAVGVTLKLLPRLESGFGCCGSPGDVADAKRVCERLGIPHYVLDMSDLFEQRVVAPFVEEYLRSRTPNPCVECNRSVKFGYLLGLLDAWKARYVATGHYARVEGGKLLKALDSAKDQTYFLYSLTRQTLPRVLFPVGGLSKSEVRRIAREIGLATADKPESQEICFVPDGDYRGFVRSRVQAASDAGRGQGVRPLPRSLANTPAGGREAAVPTGAVMPVVGGPGPIRDGRGAMIGAHRGLENFTIGQRKGLGVSSRVPLYVTAIDAGSNTLYVGEDRETFRSSLTAGPVSWTGGVPESSAAVEVRIRHRHEPAAASIEILDGNRVRVAFQSPQRAVTPGQAAVFYREDEVLGGGAILEAH